MAGLGLVCRSIEHCVRLPNRRRKTRLSFGPIRQLAFTPPIPILADLLQHATHVDIFDIEAMQEFVRVAKIADIQTSLSVSAVYLGCDLVTKLGQINNLDLITRSTVYSPMVAPLLARLRPPAAPRILTSPPAAMDCLFCFSHWRTHARRPAVEAAAVLEARAFPLERRIM